MKGMCWQIPAAGAATGGTALPFLLGAIPFMAASTAAICTTVQINEYDKLTGNNRSPIEFSSTLAENVMTGYTSGAMIAAVIEAAPGVLYYAGTNVIAGLGKSCFTEKVVPVIVKTGIGALVTAEGFCGGNEMIHQCELYYANEYLEEIVTDLATVLEMTYDEKDVEAASKERDRCSLKNIFILKEKAVCCVLTVMIEIL